MRDCASRSSQGGEQAEGWVSKDTVWLGVVGRVAAHLGIEAISGSIEDACARTALQPCAAF